MQSLIYSLWFDTHSKGAALQAVESLFNLFHESFQPDMDNSGEYTPYIQLADNYFLMVIESHWTPGDICGLIRGKRLIDTDESVMAIAMMKDAYVPHHGLAGRLVSLTDVRAWGSEASQLTYKRV